MITNNLGSKGTSTPSLRPTSEASTSTKLEDRPERLNPSCQEERYVGKISFPQGHVRAAVCEKRDKLPANVVRASVFGVGTLVRVLLFGVLVFQLGPACGFANAAAMPSMECCRTKCPTRSSRTPATCCRISASSDKATSSTTTTKAFQGAFALSIGYLAPVG